MTPSNPEDGKELFHPVFGKMFCHSAYVVHPQWLPRFGLSEVPSPIGELWKLEKNSPFLGKADALSVIVTSADWADVLAGTLEEGAFTPQQVDAYRTFMNALPSIEVRIRAALLEHYHRCIKVIDYGHDDFQPVSSVEPLISDCYDWRISIPWQDAQPRCVSLSCRCAWEIEHGLTAEFQDEQLIEME